ncbi:MAG TPA: hypothetical protein VEA99_15515 [Gemmatimonadaceae bacterium]|nr:hypothetical protein [Gemmatimonadaceae bacterium]
MPGKTKLPMGAAPPPPIRPPVPTQSHFTRTSEYVDKSVPYLKSTRYSPFFGGADPDGPLGDTGAWTDLAPDEIKMIPVSESPERGLWDISAEEAQKTLVEGTITLCDGPIRARLGEIGIRRQEWESATPDARKVIKEYLRAEAELVEVVVAATLIPADHDTEQIQKKAQRYLAEVTADLWDRARATNSPLTAIRRDQAWRSAQPLLAKLTELLAKIEHQAEEHDLVNDHAWVASQTAKVNEFLTTFRNGLYGASAACVTEEMMRELKIKHAKRLAREITHHLHQDVSTDDLGRRKPPRQRTNSAKAGDNK